MLKSRNLILLSLATTVLFGMYGCNGSSGTGGIESVANYQIQGVLIEDMNQSTGRAEVIVSRNDTLLDSAYVWIGSQTLSYDIATASYQWAVDSSGTFTQGSYNLILADLPDLIDTLLIDIADTFSLTVSNPPNRENPGGDVVTLDWTESPGTDAYVMAVVPKNLAYTNAGYSEWVGSSEGTIPINAFRWSDGIAIDTGWYYIFAYSYVGAPDSATSADLLPVPLPSDRPANIDQEPISGWFGTIVVSGRDSVHVIIQP